MTLPSKTQMADSGEWSIEVGSNRRPLHTWFCDHQIDRHHSFIWNDCFAWQLNWYKCTQLTSRERMELTPMTTQLMQLFRHFSPLFLVYTHKFFKCEPLKPISLALRCGGGLKFFSKSKYPFSSRFITRDKIAFCPSRAHICFAILFELIVVL